MMPLPFLPVFEAVGKRLSSAAVMMVRYKYVKPGRTTDSVVIARRACRRGDEPVLW